MFAKYEIYLKVIRHVLHTLCIIKYCFTFFADNNLITWIHVWKINFSKMEFDQVFDHIGHFGLYQLLLYLLAGYFAITHGYQTIAMIFLGLDQDHWCKVDELQDFPYSMQQYIAIPKVGNCLRKSLGLAPLFCHKDIQINLDKVAHPKISK